MKTVSKENIEGWRGLRVPGSPPMLKPLWASWICWAKNHDWRVHTTWSIFQKAGIACDRCYQSTHISGTFDKDERVLLEERRIDWSNLVLSILIFGGTLFVIAGLVVKVVT